MTLLLVAIFGGVGSLVRWSMEYVVRRRHPVQRPWATVAANTLGALIAGWAGMRLTAGTDSHLRSVILTGFCGGLTTFSSAFAIPAILNKEHHWRYAVGIVLTTPLLSAGAFWLGTSLGH